MSKKWMLHVGLSSPLKEMVQQEAKDSGLSFAAVVRKRLLKSYGDELEAWRNEQKESDKID